MIDCIRAHFIVVVPPKVLLPIHFNAFLQVYKNVFTIFQQV